MTRTLRATMAVLAAAGLLAGAAETASARTAHEITSILNFGPQRAENRTMKPRYINLHGYYTLCPYSQFVETGSRVHGARYHLHLVGRYRWGDRLVRQINGYQHNTSLINTATGGRASTFHYEDGGPGNGHYKWGSTLTRERGGHGVTCR